MGFRSGAYATVWETTSVSDTFTKVRLSTSRKKKGSDEYETDFSGFVGFFGTANAAKALKLRQKDRIILGDVDVTNSYDKEKKVTYTNFAVFSFESADTAKGRGRDEADLKFEGGSGEPDDDALPWE